MGIDCRPDLVEVAGAVGFDVLAGFEFVGSSADWRALPLTANELS
jgi:hypothetical protein